MQIRRILVITLGIISSVQVYGAPMMSVWCSQEMPQLASRGSGREEISSYFPQSLYDRLDAISFHVDQLAEIISKRKSLDIQGAYQLIQSVYKNRERHREMGWTQLLDSLDRERIFENFNQKKISDSLELLLDPTRTPAEVAQSQFQAVLEEVKLFNRPETRAIEKVLRTYVAMHRDEVTKYHRAPATVWMRAVVRAVDGHSNH